MNEGKGGEMIWFLLMILNDNVIEGDTFSTAAHVRRMSVSASVSFFPCTDTTPPPPDE